MRATSHTTTAGQNADLEPAARQTRVEETSVRPSPTTVTQLRLAAFRGVRDRTVPLAPVTLLTGPSGSGKSAVLEAYEALARLGGGEGLGEVFGQAAGGPGAYVPRPARPDAQGRRGFRLGCTVDGPAGPVRLDLAVQTEPELRIAGERLSDAEGRTLLATALRDPSRPAVQAEWRSAGPSRTTRARFPDDRLATALLPLRVAGGSEEEQRVLAAAEQAVVALRAVFPCDPRPATMRDPVSAGDVLLRGGCDNLAAVLRRTRRECTIRHGLLTEAVRAGCAGTVEDLAYDVVGEGGDRGLMRALLVRGPDGDRTPLEWLGDGELRYVALALVLLTGPGVLSMDPAQEVLPAQQALTVLGDGLDRGLDRRQARRLLELAVRMGERGHVRLLGAAGDSGAMAGEGERLPGVRLVDLAA